MPRFFCPIPLSIGATVALPDPVVHHIHVVRLSIGEVIHLFNGDGGEYVASLTVIEKKRAFAEIKVFLPREIELPYTVTLAQALPEGAKMDWIVEKAVELGASAIQPLIAQRSVTRLSSERAEKKIVHWRSIVTAASEQCGRNRLLQITELSGFNDWVVRATPHVRLLLTPRAEQSLSTWAKHHPPQAATLLIGPEGGFSTQEENLALAQGVLPLSIGPRVLRTETAGMAALAAVNAVWGEI